MSFKCCHSNALSVSYYQHKGGKLIQAIFWFKFNYCLKNNQIKIFLREKHWEKTLREKKIQRDRKKTLREKQIKRGRGKKTLREKN